MLELLAVDPVAMAQMMGAEFSNLFSPEWYRRNAVALMNIIMIDVVLAGDNAIVVGMAASQVAPHMRARVIFWGILGAVVLRILFAAVTNQLLAIVGLTLAGGVLLLWVSWKMYREIAGGNGHSLDDVDAGMASNAVPAGGHYVGFGAAVWRIVVADVSMSLDNVLAVAGAAKGEPLVLIVGLAIAIVLMAVASHFIARILARYPWVTWIGLIIILYVALDMIWSGSHEVACKAWSDFWCKHSLGSVIKSSAKDVLLRW